MVFVGVQREEDEGESEDDKCQQTADKPRNAAFLPRRGMGDAEDIDESAGEEAERVHEEGSDTDSMTSESLLIVLREASRFGQSTQVMRKR